MPYRLFVPKQDSSRSVLPLVIFLHGAAGRGNENVSSITGGNAFIASLWITPEHQSSFPCFAVAPQCPENSFWANDRSGSPSVYLRLVVDLAEQLQKEFSIDNTRLYVIGQSMGGFGTFSLLSTYPATFAAGIPICGGGNVSNGSTLAKIPLWLFHGDQDQSVGVGRSREMVAAITKAGGHPKYTEYKGEGHTVWAKVVQERDLLPWLFAQRRSP